jgi:hypothetical protein
VFREIYSNALDADPEKHILHFPSNSSFDVFTSTSPTYAECVAIGESSKTYGGSTIGQFGEGLKVAATTAARLGGSVVVSTPQFRGKYTIRNEEGFRHPSLWFEIEQEPTQPLPSLGCTVSVAVPSANFPQYQSRFIPPAPAALSKSEPSKAVIYCKGVWVTELPKISRCNYNLNFPLNRDRSAPSTSEMLKAAGDYLTDFGVSDDVCAALLKDVETVEFEIDSIGYSSWRMDRSDTRLGKQLNEQVQSIWGEKVALITASTSDAQMQRAIRKGYAVVSVDQSIRRYLSAPTVESIPEDKHDLPSKFVKPPTEIMRKWYSIQGAFAAKSLPAPVLLFVADDDPDRPLVWSHNSSYYVTLGRDDEAVQRLLFCIGAMHYKTMMSSDHLNACGVPMELYGAAILHEEISQ